MFQSKSRLEQVLVGPEGNFSMQEINDLLGSTFDYDKLMLKEKNSSKGSCLFLLQHCVT